MADIPADHPAVTKPRQVLANDHLLLAPGKKVKSAVKGGPSIKKSKSRPDMNIRVNPASKISAGAWLTKIKASNHVPEHFQDQIESKGNTIFVTNPLKFKFPNNVIPKPWRDDWLSAFVTPEWEITTGRLDIVVKKDQSSGVSITVTHHPDLATGESISDLNKYGMTGTFTKTKDVLVERGNTLPGDVTLKSKRKLIVIANRLTLKLGNNTKNYTFNDDELVEVWFHEIACHAGRNSQNKDDFHTGKIGDEVDACARDIKDMFPKTKTVPKVENDIKVFIGP
jgi:hypothetical protein